MSRARLLLACLVVAFSLAAFGGTALAQSPDAIDQTCTQNPDQPNCGDYEGPVTEICRNVTTDPPPPTCTDEAPRNANPVNNVLTGSNGIFLRITGIVSFAIGVASVVMIIVGGFKYITAQGDPNSINSAKNTILYAIAGLLIALTAQGIIVFVINRIT